MANSVSINCVDVSVVDATCEEVSFIALFGVRKVVFSSVTPPALTPMLVVSSASVKLEESNISKAPPLPPTSIHELTALHVVTFVPYSRRYPVDSDMVVVASFDTCRRSRSGVALDTLDTAVSSASPVVELAVVSLPLSLLQW